jgi:hypothetical protein
MLLDFTARPVEWVSGLTINEKHCVSSGYLFGICVCLEAKMFGRKSVPRLII